MALLVDIPTDKGRGEIWKGTGKIKWCLRRKLHQAASLTPGVKIIIISENVGKIYANGIDGWLISPTGQVNVSFC